MNAVEKILHDGLKNNPDDWSVRIELASKIAERGAADEVAALLSDAPEAAPDEEILKKASSLAGENNPAATGLFESFVLENPSSAYAHLSLARIQAATGKLRRGKKHYDTAVALDAGLKDESLEAQLSPPAEPEPEPEPGPVPTAEPEADPEPAPVAVPEPDPEPIAIPVPKPLTPPGQEEEDVPIVSAPVPLTPPGQDPEPVEAEADPDADAEPVAVAVAEGQELDEYSEEYEEGEDDRHFIVGEGELVHAHEKEPDTKAKISALTMALLAHIVVFAILAFVVVSMPRPNPPQLVGTSIASTDNSDIQDKVVERVQRKPVQTASAQMEVISTVAASPVSMPQFDVNSTTFDALGASTDFGMSMAFDMSEDGAMVSFFGSRSVSKKVVFVVDYSASMNGPKDKLMRKELTKSLEALPNGVEYALILFAGPVWYAGQEVGKAKMHGKWKANEVRDGGKKFLWYEGWDEKNRKNSALSHYEKGFDNLPGGEYIKASRSAIRKTVKHVQETKLVFGTDWRSPLMMAMNMEPDTIYFMTDGSLPGPPKGIQKSEVMKDLLRYNAKKSRAKINTICMMVLNARDELEQLAEGSRGEFTLVLEDGTPVRGKDLDKVGKGKGKKK